VVYTHPHTPTCKQAQKPTNVEDMSDVILKFPWHPKRLGCGSLKPTGAQPEFPGSRRVNFNPRSKGRGWKPSPRIGLLFSPSCFASVCSFTLHVTPRPPAGRAEEGAAAVGSSLTETPSRDLHRLFDLGAETVSQDYEKESIHSVLNFYCCRRTVSR